MTPELHVPLVVSSISNLIVMVSPRFSLLERCTPISPSCLFAFGLYIFILAWDTFPRLILRSDSTQVRFRGNIDIFWTLTRHPMFGLNSGGNIVQQDLLFLAWEDLTALAVTDPDTAEWIIPYLDSGG